MRYILVTGAYGGMGRAVTSILLEKDTVLLLLTDKLVMRGITSFRYKLT